MLNQTHAPLAVIEPHVPLALRYPVIEAHGLLALRYTHTETVKRKVVTVRMRELHYSTTDIEACSARTLEHPFGVLALGTLGLRPPLRHTHLEWASYPTSTRIVGVIDLSLPNLNPKPLHP